MSSQLQQQPQQPNVSQQPFMVYPNTITGQPMPLSQSHSNSNGSFGMVFIVLAVIFAVSALACCLGRFCNRRHNNPRPKQSYPAPSRPPKESDVEFGFDKKANHHEPKPKLNQEVPQVKEKEIEFAFERKPRIPRTGGNGEFGLGYKPSDGRFPYEPKPADDV